MIQITKTAVNNLDGAVRGMRNAMNSHNRADSELAIGNFESIEYSLDRVINSYLSEGDDVNRVNVISNWLIENSCLFTDDSYSNEVNFFLGKNDLKLIQKLVLAGAPSHRKFLRQIQVSFDINAPMYWWKEFDTYKVATVRNSESTMHKLATTPITEDCFSFAFGDQWSLEGDVDTDIREQVVNMCEYLRQQYLITKDKKYWRALIQLLPSGWNQKSTMTLNYEVLRNIYFDRRNHKLTEWHEFCEWIKSLPYSVELITIVNKEELDWLLK